MDDLIEIFQFVPDRSQSRKEFARKLTKELFPQLEMSPTRGGQIRSQTLLQHADGPYQWVIAYESMGGSWYEANVRTARNTLESIAVVYASNRWTVLKSLKKSRSTAVGPFPIAIGQSYRSYVRLYRIDRKRRSKPQAFETAMSEEVLPQVRMLIHSRLGHTTSTVLLKEPAERRGEHDRYLWLVSRFSKIDHTSFTGEGDTTNALQNFRSLGAVYGFADFKVLHHQTAQP